MQQVVLFVGALALIGGSIAVAGSALFGGWSGASLTLWLFIVGLPMLLASGGSAGAVPFGSNRLGGSAWNESMANEDLARRLNDNRPEQIRREVRLSWTTAIALAGVVLLLAAGVVTFAF